MFDKKLVVIYYHTPANQEIVESDVNEFYTKLEEMNDDTSGVILEKFFSPSANELNDKIKSLTKDYHNEIYLHFSGHGLDKGIPFRNWMVENDDFATMVDDPKIVFCFFSSCQSGDLAQIVAKKDIPVVIGTSGNNNIENAYAIEFQKKFYHYLFQKKTFEQAFDKATNDLKQREEAPLNTSKLVRGNVAGNIFESISPNKLQIIVQTQKEYERYLVYPSIVDEIAFVPEEKQILVVYGLETNLNEFEGIFNENGLHEYVKLFLLKKKELESKLLEIRDLEQFFLIRQMKFLFLVHSDTPLFNHLKLKTVFEKISTFPDLSFGLAKKRGLDDTEVFKDGDFFKAELAKLDTFDYDNFTELFQTDEFEKFYSELTIDISQRVKYLMKFPCKPTKKEVRELQDPEHYVGAFFAPRKYEKLINFIIQWLRRFKKVDTPIIIADVVHESSIKPIDAIGDAIKQTYKDQAFYQLLPPTALFPLIVSQGHIIVCRTSLKKDQLVELSEDIESLLTEIDSSLKGVGKPPRPTFLFLINDDNFQFVGNYPAPLAKTTEKRFSSPQAVDLTLFETWTDKLRDEDEDFDRLLDEITKHIFGTADQQVKKDPIHVIEQVCENFKIPQKQILNIS